MFWQNSTSLINISDSTTDEKTPSSPEGKPSLLGGVFVFRCGLWTCTLKFGGTHEREVLPLRPQVPGGSRGHLRRDPGVLRSRGLSARTRCRCEQLHFFPFPLLDSVVCPSGPHPPLLLARRPNRTGVTQEAGPPPAVPAYYEVFMASRVQRSSPSYLPVGRRRPGVGQRTAPHMYLRTIDRSSTQSACGSKDIKRAESWAPKHPSLLQVLVFTRCRSFVLSLVRVLGQHVLFCCICFSSH